MLNELFSSLKAEWEKLHTASNDWISQLEGKYSSSEPSDPEAKVVRETIVKKSFVLSSTDQQLRNAHPDTHADLRELATKVKTYLDMTETLHDELTQRSQSDPKVQEYANSVQAARTAVSEQVIKIYQSTIVDTALPAGTTPGTGQPSSTTAASQPASTTLATTAQQGGRTVATAHASSWANHASNLFLTTMNCLLVNQSPNSKIVVKKGFVDITQQFFDNESFSSNVTYTLSDDNIDALTQNWSAVVAVFADPAKAPSKCTSDFINDPVQLESDLFLIHDQLEILYDHLETDVTRTDESILSISI